ncbi:SDR family oxidoreductase [Candidatus Leptofilum sp.]|uniref:SDR family oxidoreductase n=1 Tax=Candidatus Leptofilum sp. TaxID=3241576 RepID=UPI003B598BE8
MTHWQPDMLRGQTAVITGVSRKIGIGAAIARALAEVGCNIFTTYFRPYDATMPWGSQADEATEIIADLQQMGVEAAGLELDLSQPTAPAELFAMVQERFGQANILVNNATHSVNGNIEELTAVSLQNHLAVNVQGMALLCQAFVQQFDEGAWVENGRIINLSSGQSHGPMPDELAYAASKGAVEAFSLSLSAALVNRGITVNAIDPGITDTGWIPDDLHQQFVAQAPMGRIGTPEDAARLVRFLASPEAGWITGQLIRSRGGL